MLFRSNKMHFKDTVILIRVDIMCLSTLTADASPQTLTSGVVNVAGSRVGPHPLKTKDDYVCEANKAARSEHQKNMLWILVRQANSEDQKVPIKLDRIQHPNKGSSSSNTRCLPTINVPTTELSTVFEILNQSEEIRKRLCLPAIVVVMDQALYAKAAEIAWKQDQFSSIVLRMGTFHTICIALSILGKQFEDSGLKDIFIES